MLLPCCSSASRLNSRMSPSFSAPFDWQPRTKNKQKQKMGTKRTLLMRFKNALCLSTPRPLSKSCVDIWDGHDFFLAAFLEIISFRLFGITVIIIVAVFSLCIRIILTRGPVTHARWHSYRWNCLLMLFMKARVTKCNCADRSAPLDPNSQSKHFFLSGPDSKSPRVLTASVYYRQLIADYMFDTRGPLDDSWPFNLKWLMATRSHLRPHCKNWIWQEGVKEQIRVSKHTSHPLNTFQPLCWVLGLKMKWVDDSSKPMLCMFLQRTRYRVRAISVQPVQRWQKNSNYVLH